MQKKSGNFNESSYDGNLLERLRWAVDQTGGASAVCRIAGMPMSTLSGYLNGSEPRFTRMAAVARACNVSLDWLAYGTRGTAELAALAIFKPAALDSPPHYLGLVSLITSAREYHERVGLKPSLFQVFEWVSPHYERASKVPDLSYEIIPTRLDQEAK